MIHDTNISHFLLILNEKMCRYHVFGIGVNIFHSLEVSTMEVEAGRSVILQDGDKLQTKEDITCYNAVTMITPPNL